MGMVKISFQAIDDQVFNYLGKAYNYNYYYLVLETLTVACNVISCQIHVDYSPLQQKYSEYMRLYRTLRHSAVYLHRICLQSSIQKRFICRQDCFWLQYKPTQFKLNN